MSVKPCPPRRSTWVGRFEPNVGPYTEECVTAEYADWFKEMALWLADRATLYSHDPRCPGARDHTATCTCGLDERLKAIREAK